MLIDLSHVLRNQMPVCPGTNGPEFVAQPKVFEQFGVHVQKMRMDGHVGTHLDSPKHLYAQGKTVASLEMDSFYGQAWVIDCTQLGDDRLIHVDLLQQCEHLDEVDFLLFQTGWSKKWGQPSYYHDFPVFSEMCCQRLAELPIKGVGVDTISIDPVDSTLENHKQILSQGKVIIENLKGLSALAGKRFTFTCFPLKITNGDGSPIRAVAIL
jgi:kynurenine formamidase